MIRPCAILYLLTPAGVGVHKKHTVTERFPGTFPASISTDPHPQILLGIHPIEIPPLQYLLTHKSPLFAGALGHHPRPDDPGQDHWRRPPGGRLRGPAGHHGDGGPRRAHVPGRHTQREPPGHDLGNQDPREVATARDVRAPRQVRGTDLVCWN